MEEGGHCLENNFKLSVKSNPRLLWFCFVSLCDWSRKLVPLSQPIRFKTKTNESWSFVFFTFQIVYLFYFGFSMAPFHIFLTSDWLSWLLWFWCESTPLKCILWSLCLLNWFNKCRLMSGGRRNIHCKDYISELSCTLYKVHDNWVAHDVFHSKTIARHSLSLTVIEVHCALFYQTYYIAERSRTERLNGKIIDLPPKI